MKETEEVMSSNDLSGEVIPNIQNFIYVVRGKQVMIDSDLATLYQVETKNLNQFSRNPVSFS